ncbi:MAG: electron transport complex subunit RsxC [Elusimicrobiota bacterium]
MDWTKFELKPKEEIIALLQGVNNIFVISCKKCFKELNPSDDITGSDECPAVSKIVEEANKKIVGCIDVDFLCNKLLTEKLIPKDFQSAEVICVISCGIGVQTVANLIKDKPVYCLTNSVFKTGHSGEHGMALAEERCGACGDCVLDITEGICPVTNCAKQLRNGSCGGAKNGKCEVKNSDGSQRDCAWEKIYKRLNAVVSGSPRLNAREKTIAGEQSVEIKDHSKPDFDTINSCSIDIRNKRQQSFYGGLYPKENKKQTENKPIQPFPEPKFLIIPLSQHIGKICEPLVKVGDRVKVGQKIGDVSSEFLGVPVHSSVSGKVIEIELRNHPLSIEKVLAITIESDGKNEVQKSETLCIDENWQPEQAIKMIREAGIVGLGGAQFPTYAKLCPPKNKPIDTVILNGAECEPYLTADYRVMLEKPEELLAGLRAIMKILNVENGVIAIEDNKEDAIERLNNVIASREATKQSQTNKIKVVELKTKYPQGSERMLIKKILNRDVPLGGLPYDVGVIVNNVSTAVAVYEALYKGISLIKRVITVTGDNCVRPGNYEIKIGTLFQDIMEYCFSLPYPFTCGEPTWLSPTPYSLKMGGPMMGILQNNLDVPVIKGTTGILVSAKPDIQSDLSRSCIKCGRCVDACPMELLPLYYAFYVDQVGSPVAKKQQWQETKQLGVMNCIECGCCDDVCPAKRSIVGAVKIAKKAVHSS